MWVGGKSKIAKEINKIIEKNPHDKYVEPFAGAAHVYFKKKPAEKSIINDINKPLIRFYKQLKSGVDLKSCNTYPNRKKFFRLKKKIEAGNGTACDFLFVNKNSFSGKMTTTRHVHNCDKLQNPTKCGITKLTPERTQEFKERMKKTTVLNQDYRKVLQKHDGKNTLFYIDSPYEGKAKSMYRTKQEDVNPDVVAKNVKKLKGKAIVSFNDSPTVRKAFKGFHILPIEFKYSASQKGTDKKPTRELLITNFKTGCKWDKKKKELRCN